MSTEGESFMVEAERERRVDEALFTLFQTKMRRVMTRMSEEMEALSPAAM